MGSRQYFCNITKEGAWWSWCIWYMAKEPLGMMLLKNGGRKYRHRAQAKADAKAYANKVEINCRF